IAAFWDLLPTFCDMTGATPPEGIDGVSLLPTWTGQQGQQQHSFLYWEFPSYGGQQAVRIGNWKAIRQNMLQRNNPNPLAIELYDLSTDRAEAHNIAADHPEIVAQARQIMQREHVPSALFPMKPID
ncbi:MAG: arylsulfatase, partial [Planctomycetaceae bacterium]|nr:arylsulfatase [Planctomycetaceae bacterium]